MQQFLYSYGKLVARHPVKVAAFALSLCSGLSLGWLELLRRDPMPTGKDNESMWAMRGSSLEQEIKWVQELHNKEPWGAKAMLTFFVGKGALQGADIFTPEVFLEVLPLYQRFYNLSVTTSSGLAYNTRDLCARGATPDWPGSPAACAAWEASNRTDVTMQMACAPSPVMPCLITSPMDCFSETAETLDPSYVEVDKVADVVLPASLFGKPYATRPSLKNVTAAEMKAEASKLRITGARGCPWWTETTVFAPRAWGGGLEWSADGTLLEKVTAFSMIFLMDGPRRVAFRMSLAKQQHANEAEIDEAIHMLDKAWSNEVAAFAKTLESVEVVNLALSLADEGTKEGTEPQWWPMVGGNVLMIAFMTSVLGSCRYPLMSRLGVGNMGLWLVGLSMTASGGIMMMTGMKFNTAIVMSLPFLALGLGVDDLFVLIRYFSGLGLRFITEEDYPKIIGRLFQRAGPGVLLTSICNICAFATGSIVPVPAMADFCLSASIVSAMNLFVMMTLAPVLFMLEARRIKAQQPEAIGGCFWCHRRAIRRAQAEGQELPELSSDGVADSMEARFVKLLENKAAPALSSGLGKSLAALLCAGLIATSVVGITQKTSGYKPAELLRKDSPGYRPLELLFEQFTLFPSYLCFVDVDVPKHQLEMLDLFHEVTSTKYTSVFDLPPYLAMFYSYVGLLGPVPVPGLPNTTLADLGWRLDANQSHPIYAPAGIASQDSATFYQQFAAWDSMPLENPSLALLPENMGYLTADLTGTNEFTHENQSSRSSPLKFSFFPFYLSDLHNDAEYLVAMREVRGITERSPLKGQAFPYGAIFSSWAIFDELEPVLLRALAVDLGVIFICTLLLLRSPSAAALSTLACGLIVLEVWGISMFFLQFNMFVAAALLAGTGISVEFTAHLVAAFTLEGRDLPTQQRLGHALAQTGPAVVQGSISTLCGILPMAFSPIPFVAKYMFAPFALIVALGMLNGLIILPALLATFSCQGCVSAQPDQTKGPAGDSSSQVESEPVVVDASLPTVLTGRVADGTKEAAEKEKPFEVSF